MISIQAIRLENLETRLELRRFVCDSLELQRELAATDEERSSITEQWRDALKELSRADSALHLMRSEGCASQ